MIVDYNKASELYEFRYNMQHKLLEAADGDVLMFIDTNSNAGVADKRISAMLDEAGIEYTSFKIKENEKRFLGVVTGMFKSKAPKMSQRMYIAKIDKDNYTRELFMQALCVYDIALDLILTMTMEELQDEYYDEVHSTFF